MSIIPTYLSADTTASAPRSARFISLMLRLSVGLSVGLSVVISGCDSDPSSPSGSEASAGDSSASGDEASGEVNTNPVARFELDSDLASTALGAVPFPHDLYRNDDGGLKLTGFPNQLGVLAQLVAEIEAETGGFGTTSGLFLSFASPIDTSALPQDGGESLRDDATLALIDVDPSSPELGRRWPIYWRFAEEETTYLPANTLSVRLLEGIALRPKTKYALIVTEELAAPTSEFEMMLGESEPSEPHRAHVWRLYAPLREWLASRGDQAPQLAAASVFTTQDPVSELFLIRDFIHTLPAPEAREVESIGVQRAITNYEIFVGRYTAPRFQAGEIPYKSMGGGIELGSDGKPQIGGEEDLRFSLSVPEGEMPEGGWPVVLYAHGTGGNYQSYYRGDIAVTLAKKGLAVISIDQIHHGERDGGLCDTGDYSQCVSLLFFNFLVPKAGRDNVRQSALDYVSLMRMVQGLQIPAESSDLGQEIRFNPNKVMFMGHSQGGLNGPLFMAIEPQVLGGVLSGAGSNIAISLEQKTRPFDVNQLVRIALGISADETLDRWHPALTMLQTFIESGDSSNFAQFWFHTPPEGYQPKSVLMTVGLNDEFTPPDTTFALAVSGRVPLIEPVYQPIVALDFLGIESAGIPPISGNLASGEVTSGLAQYDMQGHFVIFDLPSAKERYGKFLQELANRPPPTIY